MTLSTKDIQQFATFRVGYLFMAHEIAEPRKAKLLAEQRRNALAFYDHVQADIKESGYRVTKRVRDIVWQALVDIRDQENERAAA